MAADAIARRVRRNNWGKLWLMESSMISSRVPRFRSAYDAERTQLCGDRALRDGGVNSGTECVGIVFERPDVAIISHQLYILVLIAIPH